MSVKTKHHHGEKHHSCNHEHDHGQVASSCGHNHNHGKLPVVLYFIGLAFYLIALFLPATTLITNLLMFVAMMTAGYHVILEGIGETITDSLRLKKLWPNVHVLMTLAAIGAAIIGDFDEGALLILIFAGAHFLEDYAENRSKREITSLLKMNPTEARLIKSNGETTLVAVETLKIGDQLQILPGDQIPTDGVIVSGGSLLNESTINGESMPLEKTVGDDIFGSTINGNGTFTMEVTKDSSDTVFAKILALVDQSQRNLSPTATKIKKIEPLYVNSVLALVPLFILAGVFLFNWGWYTSFYRGMVLMISASPCALAASAIPATLSGISNLAKRGVLFKGGSYLANLADIQVVAFDKTGTLTKGNPSVTDVYFTDQEKADHWIEIIVSMEKSANHPLAKAILNHFAQVNPIDMEVHNEIGKGLVATFENKQYQIGKKDFFSDVSMDLLDKANTLMAEGKNVVFFSEEQVVVGYLAMMDLPQESAKQVIDYLHSQKIQTVMITGDAQTTGEAVAKLLGIDEVKGNVLPENKYKIVEELQQKYGKTVMMGDGINDAPALVKSDIGFAMGDGTDVAIDVADAVIMKNDLTRFKTAHQVAKKLDKVVWQNIAFSMFIVVLLVALNFLGKIDIGIGVLAHEGSTIVVLLNGLRLLIPIQE
ncbi:metal-transporting ATPase [Enterococcus alcedinis]|uniref:Metal-transporting ATPase n=1 Tax=Enterococcus alcedinis TaxID=1274384 RepID=A0A917N4U7_9ENTE|nr:heavy metal translocating P-type ATPase [Enterococcus alcedinis]MBP2102581.1 Cd2+/Zn2+-exporting ATPase [Enterococcus alcedinis]GGI66140.1 metal-transporting ATPase [Enterococcus alcedinis]